MSLYTLSVDLHEGIDTKWKRISYPIEHTQGQWIAKEYLTKTEKITCRCLSYITWTRNIKSEPKQKESFPILKGLQLSGNSGQLSDDSRMIKQPQRDPVKEPKVGDVWRYDYSETSHTTDEIISVGDQSINILKTYADGLITNQCRSLEWIKVGIASGYTYLGNKLDGTYIEK